MDDVKLELRRQPVVFPGIEQVADSLAMSSRTLRRKLGQQEEQFQDLLDLTRQEVAQDYLGNTNLNIQQIAEYCGFQDPENFSKAFKRWQASGSRTSP
ncbi:helix-turn-helix transcriptional regulator [Pseudomonadota bacterium]